MRVRHGCGYAAGVPETPTLSQVLTLLERRADPATAEDWDRVGLVAGAPQAPISSVMFAVDPTPGVVIDAIESGADLLVTHHPMLLRGVHSIAETSSRGRSLAALVKADCALITMHTNADQALGGVNDALADVIGMGADRTPLRTLGEPGPVRLIVHVPDTHTRQVAHALASAGAGRLGDYEQCAFWVAGTGQFRPLAGARPHIGSVGELEQVAEERLEMVVPRGRIAEVVAALRAAHPYEEPAFAVVDSVTLPGAVGLGRVGEVPPTDLGTFARTVAAALPANHAGVRFAGDPRRAVQRVAVCGGAGDSLLADVGAAGVDVFVTSDLRHHPVTDFISDHDTALVDIPHAAGESLWLATWADQLVADAADRGWTLDTSVNRRNTDPWTGYEPSVGAGA